jgi:hypothetical protein
MATGRKREEMEAILMHARRVAERDADPEHARALGEFPAILRYCSTHPNPDLGMLEKLLALSVDGTAAEAGLCIYNGCVGPDRQMTMAGMLAAASAQLQRESSAAK